MHILFRYLAATPPDGHRSHIKPVDSFEKLDKTIHLPLFVGSFSARLAQWGLESLGQPEKKDETKKEDSKKDEPVAKDEKKKDEQKVEKKDEEKKEKTK